MNKKEFEEHQKKVAEIKGNNISNGIEIDEDFETDKEAEDIVCLKLSKEFGGSKEFILDFTRVTGQFLEECRKQYKKIKAVKKEVVNIESMDDKYHVVIASNLSDISYKAIMNLPYKDYKQIVDEVRDFLNEG